MSRLLAGRRTRSALPERLDALEEVLRHAGGVLPAELAQRTRATLARAGQRLRIAPEATVAALAGGTGSGKSSLFNALAGQELAAVGVRRPTTTGTSACIWSRDGQPHTAAGVGALLDWLGVQQRSVRSGGDEALDGLVLLDLPDVDSTAADHQVEVERLLPLVDLFVWVVDPQKYADGLLHERYLRPLHHHAGVSLVVLNQVDTLAPGDAERCLTDLRRLLAADGLADTPVLATSAVTGTGLPALRAALAEAVRAGHAAQARIAADLDELAAALSLTLDADRAASPPPPTRVHDRLVDALTAAAGAEVVAGAVERSWRARSAAATGLPWLRWTGRLRADPLRRLHLDGDAAGAELRRSSLPHATPVQRSRVDTALRAVADAAAVGLPAPWTQALRAAARSRQHDLADALDRAVVATDLGVAGRPLWWRLIGLLQWLLAAAAAAGVLWLAVIFVVAWLGLPDLPSVEVGPDVNGDGGGLLPLPTALLLGGVLGGLLLAGAARLVARIGGRRRRRRALARLRAAVRAVAEELVLAPVAAELDAHRAATAALARARG